MTDTSLPPESVSEPAPAEPAPLRYLVGVLYYGAIDREHDRCVNALHGHPRVYDVMELTGCPYIDIGRGIIATAVLDNPAIAGLLFIDHDMVFDPAQAIATIESAIEANETVGAAYSMRKPGHIIGAVDGTKIDPEEKVKFFEGGRRLPANYLGMGMTAIPRQVLERLVAASKSKAARQAIILAELEGLLSRVTQAVASDGTPIDPARGLTLLSELVPFLAGEDLPRLQTGISDAPVVPFFSLLQRKGYYYGEDVSFCARCHDSSIGIHLDTRIRVYHKGTYCYGLEDVGMEVPYCTTLEVVDTKTPVAAPAEFSKSPAVREAFAARKTLVGVPLPAVSTDDSTDRDAEAPSTLRPERDVGTSDPTGLSSAETLRREWSEDDTNELPARYPRSFDPTEPSAPLLEDA